MACLSGHGLPQRAWRHDALMRRGSRRTMKLSPSLGQGRPTIRPGPNFQAANEPQRLSMALVSSPAGRPGQRARGSAKRCCG